MKILMIIQDFKDYMRHYYTDDILMQEHYNRGHEVYCATPLALNYTDTLSIHCRKYTPLAELAQFDCAQKFEISSFNYVYLRAMPPVEKDFLAATYLLEKQKVTFCNHPTAIRNFNEKILCVEYFKKYMAPTIITSNKDEIMSFANEYSYPVIIKPLDAYQAHGVTKILNKEDIPKLENLHMVQSYINNVETLGSKRVFVVKDQIIGAISFLPKAGDYITNFWIIHGYANATVTEKEHKICQEIIVFLQNNKVNFAAVDFIDEYLMEVNITSPGGIPEYNIHHHTSLEKVAVDVLMS